MRVYALEEVKRAVEWRIELEVKREKDKAKREEMKKGSIAHHEEREKTTEESTSKRMSTFPTSSKNKSDRRATISVGTPSPSRSGTIRRPKTPPPPVPTGPPPAYSAPPRARPSPTVAIPVPIDTSTVSRSRATSINDVLAGTLARRQTAEEQDVKGDWISSDDEAIDPVAAPSGSEALDERTSSLAVTNSAAAANNSPSLLAVPTMPRSVTNSALQARRNRPANLDLSLTRANPPPNIVPTNAPPSPAPTLMTLRQALLASPATTHASLRDSNSDHHEDVDGDADGEGNGEDEVAPSSPTTPTRERISLVEALLESRLPELPPAGSRQPQEAILLNSVSSTSDDAPPTPRTSETFSTRTRRSVGEQSIRRRRRWSVLDGLFTPGSSQPSIPAVPERADLGALSQGDSSGGEQMRQISSLGRSQSQRHLVSAPAGQDRPDTPERPATAPHDGDIFTAPGRAASTRSQPLSMTGPRFLPRIITNVFGRRSEDQPASPRFSDATEGRRSFATPTATSAPAPKLEYVKLPGTKGSLIIKAVETAKKR